MYHSNGDGGNSTSNSDGGDSTSNSDGDSAGDSYSSSTNCDQSYLNSSRNIIQIIILY